MNKYMYIVALNRNTNKKIVLRRFTRLKGTKRPLDLIERFKDTLGLDWVITLETKEMRIV